MCLPDPKSPGAEAVHPESICCGSLKPVIATRVFIWKHVTVWRRDNVDCHADRGADAATARYQVANSRRHVSLRVSLRLTAMDVCCGPPPTRVPAFLIA